MKVKEMRSLSVVELKQKKFSLQRTRLQLVAQKKMTALKQTHELRALRREIARLNTILTEKTHD